MRAILGLTILEGAPAAWDILLCVKIRPSTISVSSIVPHTDLETLTSRRSTLSGIEGLIILSTASTAIGDSVYEEPETILEESEVFTH